MGHVSDQSKLITVIIPHYNDPVGLDGCLSALEAQSLPRSQFDVVVADNGSPQGKSAIEQIVAGRAKMIVVHERGAGPARNAGAAMASTPYLAFTDADCVPDRDWLKNGIDALQARPRVHVLGGCVAIPWKKGVRHSAFQAFEKVFAFNNKSYVRKLGFTVTANMMCARGLFEHVGPFSNGVSEDLEWCRRAGSMSYNIRYVENAIVHHPARSDWASIKAKWARINRETFALDRQTIKGRFITMVRIIGLPISPIFHIPKVVFSSELSAFDKIGAIRALFMIRIWRFVDIVSIARSHSSLQRRQSRSSQESLSVSRNAGAASVSESAALDSVN